MGFSFAMELAKAGTELILISHSEEKLIRCKVKLEEQFGINVHIIPLDLLITNAVNMIGDFLETKQLFPDLLINNAGIGYYGGFSENDFSDDSNVLSLNITVPSALSKLIARRAKITAGKCTILNISSTLAFRKSPYWAVYSASKAYLLSLTRSLAYEFRGTSIRFAIFCPGKIDTNFDKQAGIKYSQEPYRDSPDTIANYALSKLSAGKQMIIPGFKNKAKYYVFRFLPDFITDSIVSKL